MGKGIKRHRHNPPGRPVAVVVGLDAAYSGPSGLAVLARDPARTVVLAGTRTGQPRTEVAVQRWLGDLIASLVRPGERVVLVAESDAFGGHAVARKLGIGIGVIEGLLLDLNAIDPDSRVDVTTGTWRAAAGIPKGIGRDAAKARAVTWAAKPTAKGGLWGVELTVDEAEALGAAHWWSCANPEWGMHERPTPPTPTGMRKESFPTQAGLVTP